MEKTKNQNMTELAKKHQPTPEDKRRWNDLGQEFVDNLNRNVLIEQEYGKN